jgi:endoglucanase
LVFRSDGYTVEKWFRVIGGLVMTRFKSMLLALGLLTLSLPNSFPAHAAVELTGVNLAGAEFNGQAFWPNATEMQYFKSKGMNVIRLPFMWERLQPTLGQNFDTTYFNALRQVVSAANAQQLKVILDPHNYARFNNAIVGSSGLSFSQYADLWTRLANEFRNNPQVIFGLMNEPNNMSTETWLQAANSAIVAIRATGATQLILVPGNAWTGAHSWTQNWYGTPNATVMTGIVDSGSNYAFELHQYFDSDFSGTSATCTAGTGSAQLTAVTAWLRTQGKKGLLGEFAGGNNTNCRTAIESALSYMQNNSDVWMGWTWWAAGPQWGEYIFTLEPTGSPAIDRPQMSWLLPFMASNNSSSIFSNGFE